MSYFIFYISHNLNPTPRLQFDYYYYFSTYYVQSAVKKLRQKLIISKIIETDEFKTLCLNNQTDPSFSTLSDIWFQYLF